MVKIQQVHSRIISSNPKVVRKKKSVFIPINVLRNRALDKLKNERVKFTNQEIMKIISIVQLNYSPTESWFGCMNQIKRDINAGYLKYDALAMWLNPDGGLSKDEPDMIREIAIECGLSN